MRTRDLVSRACVVGTICLFSPVLAGSAGAASANPGRSSAVESKLTAQFDDFAGSEDNAQSLVTGLRTGTPVTLSPVPGPGQTAASSLTFTPPTRPMGYGNVFISLALARQQLANLGITQPTTDELRAALVGGPVVTGTGATAQTVQLPGILTLRSQGKGWGMIAKSQGMNLGRVVSAMKSGGRSTIAPAADVASVGATKSQRATPDEAAASSAAVAGRAQARAQERSAGFSGETSGIVTAAGTTPGMQGNHYGAPAGIGIVRGGGSMLGAGNAAHGSSFVNGRGQ